MCCRINICNGRGVPLPYPILRYWIISVPQFQLRKVGEDDVEVEYKEEMRDGEVIGEKNVYPEGI